MLNTATVDPIPIRSEIVPVYRPGRASVPIGNRVCHACQYVAAWCICCPHGRSRCPELGCKAARAASAAMPPPRRADWIGRPPGATPDGL